jgi:hypothetical protein
MSQPLLPKRFLFHFALPCGYREPLWTDKPLEEQFRLASLAELENQTSPIEARAAWSDEGLAFWFRVTGKRQAPWCRANRPDESDGVQLWIDTRDVHNVHRASRFCHRFVLSPCGGPDNRAVAQWLPINRAREHPRAIKADQVHVRGKLFKDGYLVECFLAAGALTGFDPQEHPRLGFTFALTDRELGEHTLAVGSPMPYQEDPSFWATLELIKEQRQSVR